MEFYLSNKRKIVVKRTIHQNSASQNMEIYLHAQEHYWENFKITDHKFGHEISS